MAGSILQWNVRGTKANFKKLCLLTKKYKPAVISLQETLSTNYKTTSLTGFNILTQSSPNSTANGRVTLFINKGCVISQIQLYNLLQAVAARITLNKTITFCRICLPPSQSVSQTDLTNLIEQLPSPFVLLGDVNGHSPLWGWCDQYSPRGQMLQNVFSTMNLCVLNNGSATYIHPATGSTSVLDLSTCSPSLVLDNE